MALALHRLPLMTAPRTPGAWDAASVRRYWAVGAAFLAAFVIVDAAAQALLLTFAGVLFGTSLRGLAEWLAARLRWRVGTALIVCIVAMTALTIAVGLWIAPRIDDQLGRLADRVAEAYAELRARAEGSELWSSLLGGAVTVEEPARYVGRAAGLLISIIGVIGAAVFVGFVALYVAASPEVYRRGALQLVTPERRARIASVLDALARTLRRWMLGRMVSMAAVGVATWIGLWLLDIPLALTLGFLAGALGFVPNIGPIVSAVPALLIAATVDWWHATYVLVLYLGVNLVDGYVLTPWVVKKAVAMPAALVLGSQLVLGALWGVVGLTFATPLVACLLVIVRMLYVEDVLERASGPRVVVGP